MNVKELRELINTKEDEIRGLLNSDKEEDLTKAETLDKEVDSLKRKLSLAEKVEEEEKRGLENQRKGKRDNVQINEMRAITKSIMGKEITAEERAAITSSDNAAVLPKQFINEVEKIMKGYGDLEEYCDVIPVTKNEGSKPVVDYDQNELADVAEGADIIEGELVSTDISFKCGKYGLIQSLSSELVEDAEVEIEDVAKGNFAQIAVAKKNKKILSAIKTMATNVEGAKDYTALEDVMAKALPTVKNTLVTLCNVEGYAELKNAKDSTGRSLNLVTTGADGKEYFNGKPLITFDSSLEDLSSEEGKTKLFYSLSMKEAVKFFKRKGITVARSTEAGFKDDTVKLRVLTRFDVKPGSKRSVKRILF